MPVTRLLNAALISILAFFSSLALLGILGLWTDPQPQAAPTVSEAPPPANTTSGAPAQLASASVQALRWDADGTSFPPLAVQVLVTNPGAHALQVTDTRLQADWDGQPLDGGTQHPAVLVAPGDQATLTLRLPVPADAVQGGWRATTASGEQGSLRLRGWIGLGTDGGPTTYAPFFLNRTWTGPLATGFVGVSGCTPANPDDPAQGEACVRVASAQWQTGSDGALALGVSFTGLPGRHLHNVTARLAIAGVAAASAQLPASNASEGAADRTVVLPLGGDALAAWWPAHVAACEASPVGLALDLVVDARDGKGTTPRALAWSLAAPAFRTGLACPGA
jgi:hypothetical protein